MALVYPVISFSLYLSLAFQEESGDLLTVYFGSDDPMGSKRPATLVGVNMASVDHICDEVRKTKSKDKHQFKNIKQVLHKL